MKEILGKISLAVILLLNLSGCNQNFTESNENNTVDQSVYEEYKQAMQNQEKLESYTLNIKRSDDRTYDELSKEAFDLTAILEVENRHKNPVAKSVLDIYANGLTSKMESIFVDDRLYNTFNGIQFYDDSSFEEYEKTFLVPLEPKVFKESEIKSIQKSTEGDSIFEIELNETAAKKYYETNIELEGNKVETVRGRIIDYFDTKDRQIREKMEFETTQTVENIKIVEKVAIDIEYLKVNETSVRLDDAQKDSLKTYVHYSKIDTDAISDYDPAEDAMEDSTVNTLKKRLVNRLHYTMQNDGTYRTDFNENESYVFDFEHNQFIWTRYSNTYVYNWKADVGGFEKSCNYNFASKQASAECKEEVLDMLKNVKTFLEMELYYCGLSLNDLVSEVNID